MEETISSVRYSIDLQGICVILYIAQMLFLLMITGG